MEIPHIAGDLPRAAPPLGSEAVICSLNFPRLSLWMLPPVPLCASTN